MPKILFIDQFNKLGGGQTMLLNIIQASYPKFSIELLIPKGEYIESRLSNLGLSIPINYIQIPDFKNKKKGVTDILKLLLLSFKIASKINFLKRFDSLYINGSRLFLPCFISNIVLQKPVYYHLHLNHSKIEKKLINWISKSKHSKIITGSQFILDEFKKDYPNFEAEIITGVLDKNLSNKKHINRFGNTESLNFVVFGRITPDKGQAVLIKLATLFERQNFFIIGSKDSQNLDYFDTINNANLSNLKLIETSDPLDVSIEKYNLQVSITPSKWQEPFGLVAIESMAHSLLTLTRKTGGLQEIGKNCSGISFDTDEDLIQEVKKIIQNTPEKNYQKSQNQFQLVNKNYSFKRLEKDLERLLTNS